MFITIATAITSVIFTSYGRDGRGGVGGSRITSGRLSKKATFVSLPCECGVRCAVSRNGMEGRH